MIFFFFFFFETAQVELLYFFFVIVFSLSLLFRRGGFGLLGRVLIVVWFCCAKLTSKCSLTGLFYVWQIVLVGFWQKIQKILSPTLQCVTLQTCPGNAYIIIREGVTHNLLTNTAWIMYSQVCLSYVLQSIAWILFEAELTCVLWNPRVIFTVCLMCTYKCEMQKCHQ